MIAFEAFLPMVEAALPSYLQQNEPYARVIDEAMAYSLLSGGKRLRPCLCLYGAVFAGASAQEAMPFACALEMIHAYSLIHDDLPCMDNDDLRRGKPTNHRVYGEAMALLAGDGLLSRAFEVMAQAVCACDQAQARARAAQAMAYIAGKCGACGMIAGQVADMADLNALDPTVDRGALLAYIERNKTSALICAALVSGLILGGADASVIRDFEAYGRAFGMVFQITDDLLDELGDEKTFGKPIHSDAKNGKLTAVTLYGVEGARAQAHKWLALAHEALAAYPQADALIRLIDALPQRVF